MSFSQIKSTNLQQITLNYLILKKLGDTMSYNNGTDIFFSCNRYIYQARSNLRKKVTQVQSHASSANDLDTPIKFISVSTLTLTVAFAHLRIFHPPQLEGSLKPLWADIQNAALSGCHFHPCVVTHYISPRTMFPTVGMDSVLSAQPALHL